MHLLTDLIVDGSERPPEGEEVPNFFVGFRGCGGIERGTGHSLIGIVSQGAHKIYLLVLNESMRRHIRMMQAV